MLVAQPDLVLSADRRNALSFAAFQAMERLLQRAGPMVAVHPALPLQAEERAHAQPGRLERLFTEHYRFIWRTLRRLGVDEAQADDHAQQVFLVASQRLADVTEAKERSFLMGVAIRVASNARRARTRRREEPDSDAVAERGTDTSPEVLLDWKQRREKLDLWLCALTLELRAPFVLFELEGLSLQEIAELLELPLGTVKTRLRKARAIFLEAAGAGGAP